MDLGVPLFQETPNGYSLLLTLPKESHYVLLNLRRPFHHTKVHPGQHFFPRRQETNKIYMQMSSYKGGNVFIYILHMYGWMDACMDACMDAWMQRMHVDILVRIYADMYKYNVYIHILAYIYIYLYTHTDIHV